MPAAASITFSYREAAFVTSVYNGRAPTRFGGIAFAAAFAGLRCSLNRIRLRYDPGARASLRTPWGTDARIRSTLEADCSCGPDCRRRRSGLRLDPHWQLLPDDAHADLSVDRTRPAWASGHGRRMGHGHSRCGVGIR